MKESDDIGMDLLDSLSFSDGDRTRVSSDWRSRLQLLKVTLVKSRLGSDLADYNLSGRMSEVDDPGKVCLRINPMPRGVVWLPIFAANDFARSPDAMVYLQRMAQWPALCIQDQLVVDYLLDQSDKLTEDRQGFVFTDQSDEAILLRLAGRQCLQNEDGQSLYLSGQQVTWSAVVKPGADHDSIRLDLQPAIPGSTAEEPLMPLSGELLQGRHGRLVVSSAPEVGLWYLDLFREGPWLIPKMELAQAFYELVKVLGCSDWLCSLPQTRLIEVTGQPVLYLKSNQKPSHWHQGTLVRGYLAFRYHGSERFVGQGHGARSQEDPLGFHVNWDGDFWQCDIDIADRDWQQSLVKYLAREKILVFDGRDQSWRFSALDNFAELIDRFMAQGIEVWAEKVQLLPSSGLEIKTKGDIDWFQVGIDFTDQNGRQSRVSAIDLIRFLKRKALFVRLGEGRYCVLPQRWKDLVTKLNQWGQCLDHDGFAINHLYGVALHDSLESLGSVDTITQQRLQRLAQCHNIEPIRASRNLKVTLRPYQLQGLAWIQFLFDHHLGGILADDMGVGKTVQVISWLLHIQEQRAESVPQAVDRVLVITPRAIQGQWAKELKARAPSLFVHKLNSAQMPTSGRPFTVYLATYGYARSRYQKLQEIDFLAVILDEAQNIKTRQSQIAIAIKHLKASFRLAVTGTPFENHLGELVSLFEFLNPLLTLPINLSESSKEARIEMAREVLNLMRPLILRRMKDDILADLPEKIEATIILPLAQGQKVIYRRMLEFYRNRIRTRLEESEQGVLDNSLRIEFLEGLMRLRQIAVLPSLLTKSHQTTASGKVEYLKDRLPLLLEAGHKVVVFSQFLGFLKLLKRWLKGLSLPHHYLDGQTKDVDHILSQFRSKEPSVLLASIRTSGVGLDLSQADTCFICDPWWNPALESQAVDRLHRFGQQRPVNVYRLITEATIEEQIVELQEHKRQLTATLQKSEDGCFQAMDLASIAQLFLA